jgi:hypothetical protein
MNHRCSRVFPHFTFGRPLASTEDRRQRVGPAHGIPIFGLDALIS